MNRSELYYKTVDVLIDAYNNGELEHGNCDACAVGNICKEASLKTGIDNREWIWVFCTGFDEEEGEYIQNRLCTLPQAFQLIEATGYTVEELAQIEWVFETAIPVDKRYYYSYIKIKQGQYMGLCAVLNKLKEIHSIDEPVNSQQKLNEVAKQFNVELIELI